MKKNNACIFLLILLILFISLLSILSLPSAFASTEIFSDAIDEEETVEIDGEEYTAYEYNDYAGVRLSSNKYGSIIIEEKGDSEIKGPYTFTLDEITEGDDAISFTITVDKEEAEVSVSREASNSTGTLGDTITITVTIANEGSDTVIVKYLEDMPSEVYIVSTPEITKGTTTTTQRSSTADVYWAGALYEGETATIVYDIAIEDYPDEGTTITLNDITFTYEDDSGEYEETVDDLSIELTSPIEVLFSLATDEDDITVGAEVEYTLWLTNNLAKTATIDSLLLTLPSTVEPSTIDAAFEETDEGYLWTGQLSAFEDTSFTVIVIPQGAGTHELTAEASYSSTSRSDSTSDTATIEIEAGDVVPEIKLSSESFDAGEEILIYYYVNNSDEDISYSNAEIKITADPSDLFDTINYVASLPKKTKTLIKKQSFTAPYTDEAMEYTVTMTGTYGTSTFEESETITINAATFTVPYDLTYTIDGTDEENTNITLTVTLLTTLTETPSKISVIHTIDPDYKKTVTLAEDHVTELFSAGTYTKSWSIPVISFTEDEVEMEILLKYAVDAGTYYQHFSETIPVYHEEVEETETNSTETDAAEEDTIREETDATAESETTEKGEKTVDVTADAEEIAATDTSANLTEEVTVVITGKSEKTSKKWVWLFLIILGVGAAAFSGHYFVMKKQKQGAMKAVIESISSKEMKEEKKESFFARAKEIIIHDVPSPEDGYDKLESYIKHSISHGKTGEDIKKILVAKGWIEDILESYLQRLK